MRDAAPYLRVQLQIRLQDVVSSQDLLERLGGKWLLVGHHLNDSSHVGKEFALVAVGQQRRHGGRVELDFVVVHLDEVYGRVFLDKGQQGRLDGGGNVTLGGEREQATGGSGDGLGNGLTSWSATKTTTLVSLLTLSMASR